MRSWAAHRRVPISKFEGGRRLEPAIAGPARAAQPYFSAASFFRRAWFFALVGAWRQAAPALEGAGKDALRFVAAILGDLYQGQARFQQLVQ